MVLCRNTAPLMELYRIGINNGIKMYFRGEELGKNLVKGAEGDNLQSLLDKAVEGITAPTE